MVGALPFNYLLHWTLDDEVMFQPVPFLLYWNAWGTCLLRSMLSQQNSHATEFFINLLGLFFKKVFFILRLTLAWTWNTMWGPTNTFFLSPSILITKEWHWCLQYMNSVKCERTTTTTHTHTKKTPQKQTEIWP